MFISSYTTIYFFVKNFFFECLYFSEYDLRVFIFLFWLGNRPSIKLIELTNITFLMRSFEDKNIQNKWVDYNSDRLSTSKTFLVLVFSWEFSGEGDSPGRGGGGV